MFGGTEKWDMRFRGKGDLEKLDPALEGEESPNGLVDFYWEDISEWDLERTMWNRKVKFYIFTSHMQKIV